jgi:hypothetical protein
VAFALVQLAQRSHAAVAIVGFPVFIFEIGWLGTQRVWYLRAFRDGGLTLDEAWRFTWAFVGRFLTLGLVIGIVATPVVLPAFASRRAIGIVVGVIVTLLADFALTFVTPALAFTTRSVGDAWSVGWRMLREEWPGCAPYVLAPPLAVQALFRVVPLSQGGFAIIAFIAATLFGLVCRGAIARYYARRVDVGDDGAALIPRLS